MHFHPLLIGLLLLLLSCTSPVLAQDAASPDTTVQAADVVNAPLSASHLTLGAWAANQRLQMMDRSHAYGDRFYDRGVFRRITPPMDREYALDMVSYQFTPVQDYAWMQMDRGLRTRAGSIVRAKWALVTDLKHTLDLTDGHRLRLDARLQQDPKAQRAFLELSYDWALTPLHHVGVRHSFSEYKPDFDPSLYYQYGNARNGRVRAEMTFLNAYNDVIFGLLGVSEKDEEYVRTYSRQPYLAQLTLASPTHASLRGELHVGWQPESKLVFQSQTDSTMRYRDREAVHYLGAMVEYDVGPLTTGLIYQRQQSTLDRKGLREGITSDYQTEQRFKRGGAFVMGSWGSFRGEAWFFLEDYYDRQEGDDFSHSTVAKALNWTEYRKNYRARVFYIPNPIGPYVGVEYLALSRRLGPEPYIMGNEWTNHWYSLDPSNYRGSVIFGYRFDRGAVSIGINYDFDGDAHYKAGPNYTKKRFDNAFIRCSLSW